MNEKKVPKLKHGAGAGRVDPRSSCTRPQAKSESESGREWLNGRRVEGTEGGPVGERESIEGSGWDWEACSYLNQCSRGGIVFPHAAREAEDFGTSRAAIFHEKSNLDSC